MAVYGPIFTADKLTDGLLNINDVIQLKHILEILEGKGPMSSTGIETLLYMKTNNSIDLDPEYPDIEILQSFATVAFDTSQVTRQGIRLSQEAYDAVFKPIENRRAFQLLTMLLHPRSKGFLKLKSRNPFHHPLLYPNFFADSRDIDTLVQGVRESIRVIEQPEFKKLGAKLYNATVPGCEHTEFNSDKYWRCYIQHLSATLHHQVGTCKMGPATDKTAVVDANGLVHGIIGLRVADVSILPESPSGHTAAFGFLIGEKISNSILNDWLPKKTNIQKLMRVRKAIDWLYQDPEHVLRARENNTDATMSPTSIQRSVHLPHQAPSVEMMQVLHSLNMSALHEQNQQFKYSTIGDVGTILWGPMNATRTIDFKSKLAENANVHATNETKMKQIKPRILKRIQNVNVSTPNVNDTEQIIMTTECGVSENSAQVVEITTTKTSKNVVNLMDSGRTELKTESTTDEIGFINTTEHTNLLITPSLHKDFIQTNHSSNILLNDTSKEELLTKSLQNNYSTSSLGEELTTSEEAHKTVNLLSESTVAANDLRTRKTQQQNKTIKNSQELL